MKSQHQPKSAAHLTPRHGNMRKTSLPQPIRPSAPATKVSGEVQTKRSRRKRAVRKASGFNGIYVLAAVITLLTVLLTGTLIVTILEKPQATEAWALVREIFPPTITALLAFMGARYSLSKRP